MYSCVGHFRRFPNGLAKSRFPDEEMVLINEPALLCRPHYNRSPLSLSPFVKGTFDVSCGEAHFLVYPHCLDGSVKCKLRLGYVERKSRRH